MVDHQRLVLASGSPARRAMLSAAGLSFEISPADIDEAAIRDTMISESACVEAADIAMVLAAEKSKAVSQRMPNAIVVGSDQVMALGSRIFFKPETLRDATDALDRLRGRRHTLASAVAIARNGEVTWSTVDTAELTMRRFSDEFLGRYIEQAGDAVWSCPGGYKIEELGAQLFEQVHGNHFTILGMPLLPLLEELRRMGMILS